ncbi:hypothetical protein [Marinobacter sp.]|uniref:hypothetical protein n=1 Tax=Marinobacter sp. TaxID=50741 RepID=UPI003562BD75
MNASTQQSNRDAALHILSLWGLDSHQKDQLLSDYDNVLAVLSIHDSLVRIFDFDEERACQWPTKKNKQFSGATAVEVMLGGDCERVRSYLRYHVFNA